jgi:hypothetical protein
MKRHSKAILFLISLMKLTEMVFCEEKVFSGGPNCLIHNKYHQFDYLYSTISSSSLFLKPLGQVDQFDRLRWQIEPVGPRNTTFHILQDSKYVCSSRAKTRKVFDLFAKRFELQKIRLKPNQTAPSICEWRFEKLAKHAQVNLDEYNIWNVGQNEALFASAIVSPLNIFTTKVCLKSLDQVHFKLDRFKWFVDCQNGEFLIY